MSDIANHINSNVSIINDPFKKNQINTIHIDFYATRTYSQKAEGRVRFKNGDTEGCQNFAADTIPELLEKMKAMYDNMD